MSDKCPFCGFEKGRIEVWERNLEPLSDYAANYECTCGARGPLALGKNPSEARREARAAWRARAEVTSIEASQHESDLPDWDDLRGRAPDATGGLSSEAFVRELRDGWREAEE